MEIEVVDRLSTILRDGTTADLTTTAALATLTTLVCWVVQRVRRSNDPRAQRLWQAWQKIEASEAPWHFPKPLAGLRVSVALKQLRDALSHADDASASPVNGAVEGHKQNQLVGFVVTTEAGEVTLLEDELRRLGQVLANEYRAGLQTA